jgi:hypothetical protein
MNQYYYPKWANRIRVFTEQGWSPTVAIAKAGLSYHVLSTRGFFKSKEYLEIRKDLQTEGAVKFYVPQGEPSPFRLKKLHLYEVRYSRESDPAAYYICEVQARNKNMAKDYFHVIGPGKEGGVKILDIRLTT